MSAPITGITPNILPKKFHPVSGRASVKFALTIQSSTTPSFT